MKSFERYQGWLHVVGWAVFVGLPFLTLPDFIWNRQDLLSISMAQLLTSLVTIGFFYVNLRSLTPGLLQGQLSASRFVLILVVLLLSVAAVRVMSYYLFPPTFVVGPPPGSPPNGEPPAGARPGGPHSPWPGALSSGISFSVAVMVSSLIALFRYHTRSQEAQQQMALEKVSAELAMLKLQVSPHFLFNTLNNIRWLARQKSDQTEAAVVTLAQLLRYMIYQARQDKVPLRQEVGHLRDYIDLQQMRLTDIHTVRFTGEGDIDAYQIEPLLFIPFVENAFKYGLHSRQPGHIDIYLAVTDHRLTFSVENPTAEAGPGEWPGTDQADVDPAASGIGIANVRQRLALHYPDRHDLAITNENHRFRVSLTLYLHHDEVALRSH